MTSMTTDTICYEVPKPKISETFVYQHVLDPYELELLRRDPSFAEVLKRNMARALAEHIFKQCQVFEVPSHGDLMRGRPLRMEMTINDRGTYERWMPIERDQARREERKRVMDSLPYGMNPTEFWEQP